MFQILGKNNQYAVIAFAICFWRALTKSLSFSFNLSHSTPAFLSVLPWTLHLRFHDATVAKGPHGLFSRRWNCTKAHLDIRAIVLSIRHLEGVGGVLVWQIRAKFNLIITKKGTLTNKSAPIHSPAVTKSWENNFSLYYEYAWEVFTINSISAGTWVSV